MKSQNGIINPEYFAVIAGGSRGMGYAIALALAKRSYNLVLVARNWNDLALSKLKLEKFGVTVELLQQDLSLPGAAEKVVDFCRQRKLKVSMLCNVAGLGGVKDFMSLPVDDLRYMITLNLASQVALCKLFLPQLEKNLPSYILNVSSMAGLAPVPKKNIYASTKSAILFFSISLYHQLKPLGIGVSCLSPGPVFTKPEVKKETLESLGNLYGNLIAVDPEKVGEQAIRQTLNGKLIIIPGIVASITSFLLRILPAKMVAYLYALIGKKKS